MNFNSKKINIYENYKNVINKNWKIDSEQN